MKRKATAALASGMIAAGITVATAYALSGFALVETSKASDKVGKLTAQSAKELQAKSKDSEVKRSSARTTANKVDSQDVAPSSVTSSMPNPRPFVAGTPSPSPSYVPTTPSTSIEKRKHDDDSEEDHESEHHDDHEHEDDHEDHEDDYDD